MALTQDELLQSIKTLTDIEIATGIGSLKSNPAQLQQFLQGQQSKVYNKITGQKDLSFQKVYGDLSHSAKVQQSVLLYNKRNHELYNVQENVYENQKNSADGIIEDKNLAHRKNEMNEWSVGNKLDTLFVYSSLFILLSSLLLLILLHQTGIMNGVLIYAIIIIMIIIFIGLVINRYQYTNSHRNLHLWNKRRFQSIPGKTPTPACPTNDPQSSPSSVYSFGSSNGVEIASMGFGGFSNKDTK